MDAIRRNLLLGAGTAAMAAPAALAAAAAAAPVAVQRDVKLLSTYVAGTAYHQEGHAAATLRRGEGVALQRDRRNDYDRRAIVVRTRCGRKLGYVPRVDNHALASLMDAGFQVTARVCEVVPDRRQPDIRLDVFLMI